MHSYTHSDTDIAICILADDGQVLCIVKGNGWGGA